VYQCLSSIVDTGEEALVANLSYAGWMGKEDERRNWRNFFSSCLLDRCWGGEGGRRRLMCLRRRCGGVGAKIDCVVGEIAPDHAEPSSRLGERGEEEARQCEVPTGRYLEIELSGED
jgi:hypothetical protein